MSSSVMPAASRQRGIPDGVDVIEVLAPEHELELLPGHARRLRKGEGSALVHFPGHVEEAGAAHEGVVDVEEGCLAVLLLRNRTVGHSDVLLLGHATESSQCTPHT
jgi:hypothetical protein